MSYKYIGALNTILKGGGMVEKNKQKPNSSKGHNYFLSVCPTPPTIPNSVPQFDVNTVSTIVGTVLDYRCNTGYIPDGGVTCQGDGAWSQMSCIRG